MNKKQLLLTIAALGALCVPVQAKQNAAQMPWAQQDAFWGLNKGQATATGVGAVSLAAAAVMLAMPSVRNSARRAIKAQKSQTIFQPTTTSDYIAAGLIGTLTLAGVAALISTPFLGKKAGAASASGASGAAEGTTAKKVKDYLKANNDVVKTFKNMSPEDLKKAQIARMAEYQLYNTAEGEEKPGQYFDVEYQTDGEGKRTLKAINPAENFSANVDEAYFQTYDKDGKPELAKYTQPDEAFYSKGLEETAIGDYRNQLAERIKAERKATLAARDAIKEEKRKAWLVKPENKAADDARTAAKEKAAKEKAAKEKAAKEKADEANSYFGSVKELDAEGQKARRAKRIEEIYGKAAQAA